jgi:hypothetical protein
MGGAVLTGGTGAAIGMSGGTLGGEVVLPPLSDAVSVQVIAWPTSAAVTVYVAPVPIWVKTLRCHAYVYVVVLSTFVHVTDAPEHVSVCPCAAVPELVGTPTGTGGPITSA